LEDSTRREYKNVLVKFRTYCEGAGLRDIMQVGVEDLDAYRASRNLAPTTCLRELGTLRQFFGFCQDRRWIEENPAKKIKPPRNIRPEQVVPFTKTEVAKMLAACDEIGRGSYERLRARATILLLRFTGLRISDVATLERESPSRRPNPASHTEDWRRSVPSHPTRASVSP